MNTDRDWTYSVKYARRKTIGIYVSAEEGVEVRVPHYVSRREADAFVQLKRDWIEKQLQAISSRPQRFEPTYGWGEAFYFLGEKQVFHWQDHAGVDVVLASKPRGSAGYPCPPYAHPRARIQRIRRFHPGNPAR